MSSAEKTTEANIAIFICSVFFKSNFSESIPRLSLLDSNLRFPPRNSSVWAFKAFSNLSVNNEIPETIVIASVKEISIEVKYPDLISLSSNLVDKAKSIIRLFFPVLN